MRYCTTILKILRGKESLLKFLEFRADAKNVRGKESLLEFSEFRTDAKSVRTVQTRKAKTGFVNYRFFAFTKEKLVMLYFSIVLAAMSAVTLVLYGADKSKAKRGAWRIPEKVLLGCSLLCGAVGGLAGMLLFRHKTKHWYFWAVNFLGLAWQVAVFILLAVKGV